MSWGAVAVVLIRLEARRGEWVSVADLATHMACAPALVRSTLEQLHAEDRDGVDVQEEGGLIVRARVFYRGGVVSACV